jgi:DNA repair exonuclease SbcCD ATPase subunit
VKFLTLEIENCLSIGEARVSLDGQGLVSISGDNQDDTSADSNGTGKSSVVDSLAWCLWGTTARGVSGDDVVSWFCGKGQGTRVATTVEDDGELYQVVRHRKYPKQGNKLQLFKEENGQWVDLTKGTTSLTQKQIERLLGCSEEVFNAAVYSGQEVMPDIPNMTDKQLKLLVEQAAGVDVLSNAYDLARERARRASETRAAAQIGYDRANDRLTDAMNSLTAAEANAANWGTQQQAKIARLKVETVQRAAAFKTAKDARDPNADAVLDARIAEVQAKIDAVVGERQREASLQTTYNTVASTYHTAKAALDRAARDLATRQHELAHVDAEVGKACRSCGKEVTAEDLVTTKKIAQENVTAATTELETRKQKLAAAEKMLADADAELVKHRESMTDISASTTEMSALHREKQIVAAEDAEISRLREAARTAALQAQAAEQECNPFLSMVEQAKQAITDRSAMVETAKANTLTAIEEEKYAQAVVTVFAPAGVRARRLDEATPYLNQRTAHYLGSLADGAIEAFWTTLTETKDKKELREKFSVTVEKKGAGTGSFKNLSGGEKRKVRLACALALQDLVATRAAKTIALWVGDEVDDALDSAGLERLMGVLEEKARERGTVLVISHNDIKDFCRQEIRVTKQNGRATVVQV